MPVERETTLDTVFAGSLNCLQYRQGYRFNQDSVVLANFVHPSPFERVLDLGAGCGIIGLILLSRTPTLSVVGLEIQPDLVFLAERNARDNGFAGRLECLEGDLNDERVLRSGSFDRIVCNPPYLDPGRSRRPEDNEMAVARQGLRAGPKDLVAAAGRLLADGGRFDLIYPAGRLDRLLSCLKQSTVAPVKMREVYNHAHGRKTLVMVEAEKNGGRKRVEILPPFNVYDKEGGGYSREMKSYYRL